MSNRSRRSLRTRPGIPRIQRPWERLSSSRKVHGKSKVITSSTRSESARVCRACALESSVILADGKRSRSADRNGIAITTSPMCHSSDTRILCGWPGRSPRGGSTRRRIGSSGASTRSAFLAQRSLRSDTSHVCATGCESPYRLIKGRKVMLSVLLRMSTCPSPLGHGARD